MGKGIVEGECGGCSGSVVAAIVVAAVGTIAQIVGRGGRRSGGSTGTIRDDNSWALHAGLITIAAIVVIIIIVVVVIAIGISMVGVTIAVTTCRRSRY